MRHLCATLALCCAALTATAEPQLKQTSQLIWSLKAPWFGGFSGMEISSDGAEMMLVTDKGIVVRAKVQRDGEELQGITLLAASPLLKGNGERMSKGGSDSEGLAVGPNGNIFMSFEHWHRVAQITVGTAKTQKTLPTNEAFAAMQPNGSLEALAIHPDGSLYTLPEEPLGGAQTFPLWRFYQGSWSQSHRIPKRGRFLPVGADFDDRGRLYLLERSVTPVGFRSRIRRFTLTADTPAEETLLTTLPGKFDNLEALSLWRNAGGVLHLTMISDDNFLPIQRTQIVEYSVTE